MELDNKTRAAVLREYADNMSEPGVDRSVYQLARSEADKLDPPEKPIHPHDGCEGMVVKFVGASGNRVYIGSWCREDFEIPREASKVPAFLCDGTRPEWLPDECIIIFPMSTYPHDPGSVSWGRMEGKKFSAIIPIEVQ